MDDEWLIHKVRDGEVHGPVPLQELVLLASEAKISPMDRVSNDDQKTWRRAPMIPELEMDWLIEMEDNYLYGPTTVSSILDFLLSGEITPQVRVINCKDRISGVLEDLPLFQESLVRKQNEAVEMARFAEEEAAREEARARAVQEEEEASRPVAGDALLPLSSEATQESAPANEGDRLRDVENEMFYLKAEMEEMRKMLVDLHRLVISGH